jgi:hypothetical protein
MAGGEGRERERGDRETERERKENCEAQPNEKLVD